MQIRRCGNSDFVKLALVNPGMDQAAQMEASRQALEAAQSVVVPMEALKQSVTKLLDVDLKNKLTPHIGNMERALAEWKAATAASQIGISNAGAPPVI